MKLHWTRRALRRLHDITAYIAEDRPSSAAGVAEHIELSASMLTQHALLGRAGRQKSARELVVADTPYIIVYRVARTRVEILTVIHAARRWPDAL